MSWLSMLVLVRLLEPEAFGLLSLAYTVVAALEYLRGSGIWAALVHRRSQIEEAAASALVYLAVSSLAVYAICFALAPFIANAFHAAQLTGVLRALAVITVFSGLNAVPSAIIERELAYSLSARIDIAAAIGQGATSIALALAGVGVWSLVAGQIVSAALEFIFLWLLAPWRPSPRLASWSMLRELSRYARFAGVWSFATFVKGTVDNISVGRLLGATSVGFYSVAFRLATSPDSLLSYVILKAMFPAFSSIQHEPEAFRRTFLQHVQRMLLLVFPVAVFLVLGAEPVVLTLLGRDWASIVTPVRILAVAGFVSAISATTSAVFRGAGRPELAMRYVVANVILLVPALIVLIKVWKIDGASTAVLVCLAVTTLPAVVRTLQLIGLSFRTLFEASRPALICSAILAAVLAVLLPATSDARPIVAFLVLLGGGIAAYLGSTAIFARGVLLPMWLDLRGSRT
jgi:PST family polysaccharide transporter